MNLFLHLLKEKIIKTIEILLWPFISLFVLYYLYKNNKIFNNKIIFLSWHWSFGHQSIMLDSCAKLFKKKISLLSIIYSKRNNEYLNKIYHKYYEEYLLIKSNNPLICKSIYKISLSILKLIIFLKKRNTLVTYDDIRMKQLKKFKFPIKFYNEFSNSIVVNPDHHYWYDKLLKKKLDLCLPKNFYNECIDFFKKNNCNLKKKKIVNLFFRDYQNKNTKLHKNNYFDLLRMNYEPKNYIKAILWLAKKNFIIFIHCSNRIKVFNEIKHPNVFLFNNLKSFLNRELLNVFLILIGKIHISQNSGSALPAFALKQKVIICDTFPFSNGFPGKSSILFPKIFIKNKRLTFEKYVNTDFFYGKGFYNSKTKIVPNTSDEILKIIKTNILIKNKCTNINKVKFNKSSGIFFRQKINKVFY